MLIVGKHGKSYDIIRIDVSL